MSWKKINRNQSTFSTVPLFFSKPAVAYKLTAEAYSPQEILQSYKENTLEERQQLDCKS